MYGINFVEPFLGVQWESGILSFSSYGVFGINYVEPVLGSPEQRKPNLFSRMYGINFVEPFLGVLGQRKPNLFSTSLVFL